jgi:hypothetical protein
VYDPDLDAGNDEDEDEQQPTLVIRFGDEEFWAECGLCGVQLGGPLRPDQSLDLFQPRWEHHTMTECEA